MTEAGKKYLNNNFVNGTYVEGYTFLTTEDDGGISLSLPSWASTGTGAAWMCSMPTYPETETCCAPPWLILIRLAAVISWG